MDVEMFEIRCCSAIYEKKKHFIHLFYNTDLRLWFPVFQFLFRLVAS